MLQKLSFVSLVATALFAAALPVYAKDCGMPPGPPPAIPNGATASSDVINAAVRAIQDYGFEVQTYLNCMNLNRDFYYLNMNDDQRERWAEDYNAMADALTEAEVALNEQLRIYNAR